MYSENNIIFVDYPGLLTTNDLQKALGIGRSMVYRLIKSGDIKHLRIGNAIKIPKRFVIDFVLQSCYDEPCSDVPVVKGG